MIVQVLHFCVNSRHNICIYIFTLCEINTRIGVDKLGHVLNLTQNFVQLAKRG